MAKRKLRRCVYCQSTYMKRRELEPWRWLCLACMNVQPDKRYDDPRIVAFREKRKADEAIRLLGRA